MQPMEIIDDYDYNEDDDDFNRRLRIDYEQIWLGFADGFLGFTDSVLGNFSNSTETESCWRRSMEISQKTV